MRMKVLLMESREGKKERKGEKRGRERENAVQRSIAEDDAEIIRSKPATAGPLPWGVHFVCWNQCGSSAQNYPSMRQSNVKHVTCINQSGRLVDLVWLSLKPTVWAIEALWVKIGGKFGSHQTVLIPTQNHQFWNRKCYPLHCLQQHSTMRHPAGDHCSSTFLPPLAASIEVSHSTMY